MEKCEFQPKQWVLVRDDDKEPWELNIFSRKEDDDMFWCVSGWYYKCIPYEGNEHLLGKTDAPEEKKLDGWKVGDKVEVEYDTDKKWYGGEIVMTDLSKRSCVDGEAMPYYVRSECFKYNDGCAWCAARQLREPIEKNADEGWNVGDIVEVKNERDGCWYPGKILLIKKGAMPYFVQSEFGFKEVSKLTRCSWCSKDQLRKPGEKPEKAKEWRPNKGEVVEVLVYDEWQTATLVLDDHTDNMPYRVRLDSGEYYWCHKNHTRPAQKKTEEPFKFGDRVEVNFAEDWREAVIIEIDSSSIPYKVATPDGEIHWRRKGDVRRA